MKISPKQLESILALNDEMRYLHFIKVVVDWEEIYLSYEINEDSIDCCLWPAKEYAEIYMKNVSGALGDPAVKDLSDFMRSIFFEVDKKKGILRVFPTNESNGFFVKTDRFKKDIEEELLKYE